MSRRTFAVLLASLLTAAAAAAAEYDLRETVLDNGLRVVVAEDHSCPIVAVQVWYHVGSKDERPDRTGFAHMFEHMMFRGTDRLGPEDHFEYVRGTGGDCNAFTSFDQTVYVQTVPSNQLPMVLWLEAERMARLRVDEEGFATERRVVEEERRLGLEQPYGTVMEKALARIYREHPYRWTPIGEIEHLRAATSEELLRFWETYYVPNNATLVVVGDVDAEEVFAEAERAFGWIPRCPDPPRVETREPLPGEPLEIEIRESRGPAPIVAAAWRTVPLDHPDRVPLDVLMHVLGGGESSRLHRRLVDEEEKAVFAMAGGLNLEHDGFAATGAVVMPFGDLDGALTLLEEEVARIRSEPVGEAELGKAKTNLLRSLVDESQTVASKAQQIGNAALFLGGAQALNRRAEAIEAVTVDDLRRVAEEYLVPERRVTLRVKPTLGGMLKTLLGGLAGKSEPAAAEEESKPEAPTTSTMADRRGPKAEAAPPPEYPAAPPVAPPLAVEVPLQAVERTLANGLRVFVVENHEVPLVSVRLGLLDGAATDPADAPGAAAMACAVLTKGTERLDAQALADELETHAIRLGASADMDSVSVAGSAVTGQLGRLVRLLAEVVVTPRFDPKEFEKVRRQVLTGLAIAEKEPDAIADRTLARAIFGDHPYARTETGTSDEVRALDVEECARWWRAAARPDRAALFFAGDVDPETAFELAEAFLGDWEAAGEPLPAVEAEPAAPEATRILLVDQPGSVQSQIRVAQLGITRKDARWDAARVLTQVFGGAFNSRLNETIRVQKGLTYGARGGFAADEQLGRFHVSTFSKTATAVEAVRAILEEIDRLRAEPPSDDELRMAQSYLVGSFAGDLETPAAVASALWLLFREDLPPTFLTESLARVANVTRDDVAALANDLVDPEHLVIVVVGDAATLRDGLAEIAPVTELDPEGNPVERKRPAKPGDD